MLIFICMFFLPEGQTGEAWEPSQTREAFDRKLLSLFNVVGLGYHWTGRGSNSSRSKRLFSALKYPDWLWGPPKLQFSGCHVSWPVAKRLRREADPSPPPNNKWTCTSNPSTCLQRITSHFPVLEGSTSLNTYWQVKTFRRCDEMFWSFLQMIHFHM